LKQILHRLIGQINLFHITCYCSKPLCTYIYDWAKFRVFHLDLITCQWHELICRTWGCWMY
jgi:hypothetical protein